MKIRIGSSDESVGSLTNTGDIFTIAVNDFGDEYHRNSDDASSELERRVRQIKRRYKNINDYYSAVNDYNEWMIYLRSLYTVSDKVFTVMLKNRALNEYIPKKPKIKDNSSLRYLVKNNIILSIDDKLFNSNEEYIMNKLNSVEFNTDEVKDCRMSREEVIKVTNELRKETTINTRATSSINLLDEYFKMKSVSKKPLTEDDIFETREYSLTDLYNNGDIIDINGENDDDSDYETVIYEGQLVTRKEAKELQLYKLLYDLGWNSYRLHNRLKDSKSSKTVNKLLKINKKKKKKNKKSDDKFLIDIMQDAGYDDFNDYEFEMSNCDFDKLLNF